ncbi:sensor histidine kinase [Siccirubricoccus sp. G192]|nr:sensor histidine kinase [Siccirubricoccus sp. G192]
MSHYDVTAEPLRDGGGPGAAVVGITVAALDITSHAAAVQALRLQDERQHLLLNELNHRVKNSLAAVQAIAAQTLGAAPDLETAKARLQARLLALSAAHDVLTRESWEGASLAELFDAALAPLRPAEPGRVLREGPPIWLPPRAVLALTLAFHELATNAAKYGALSVPAGRVTVEWALRPGRLLWLRWTESGGPHVAPPTRRGFGSRLIERSLAHDLRGRVAMGFRPNGVVCTIEAALPPERDAAAVAWQGPAAEGAGEGKLAAEPQEG